MTRFGLGMVLWPYLKDKCLLLQTFYPNPIVSAQISVTMMCLLNIVALLTFIF
jgi:hypothetical protein